jgi:hypothetical protein
MPSYPPSDLEAAVDRRYAPLAEGCDSLACGGALDLAALVQGEVLVDLGSDRGRDVIRAARLIGPNGRAIGIDRMQAMIDKAVSATPSDLTNATFVCCDLAALALDSARREGHRAGRALRQAGRAIRRSHRSGGGDHRNGSREQGQALRPR